MVSLAPPNCATLLQSSQEAAASVESRHELWRHDRCPSDCQRPTLALSWVLALALTCLTVGGIGLTTPVKRPFQLLTMASAPVGDENAELAMVEMSAPVAEQSPDTAAEETALDLFLPEPEAIPEVTPQILEDLPEIAEILTAEDLFTVPAAAPVEDMLKPETPRPPQPAPRPRSAPSTASRAPATGSTATTTSASGGTGGTGTSARGSSKGYFPAPPYPAAARTRGIQGTVYLSITFGADGRVTSASVSRSSGYSDLDRAASDWVRRNWRAPAGQTGTYRQPVQFRLR